MSDVLIWKFHPDFEGYVEISTEGGVRTVSRLVTYPQGWSKTVKGKSIARRVSDRGYYTSTLQVAGKPVPQQIHRLVAETFIPNPDNLPFINHKDGNKLNNCVENLEWCTAEQNLQHAARTDLMRTGSRHRDAKLSESDALEIVRLDTLGVSKNIIASQFGVCYRTVYNVLTGRNWSNVTGIPYSRKSRSK